MGFLGGALLLMLLKRLVRRPELYRGPEPGQPPPPWIRAILVLTCTRVSFAHGSNDGQKGMGLVMLILVGILPGTYALRMDMATAVIRQVAADARPAVAVLERHAGGRVLAEDEAARELTRFLTYESRAGALTFPALAAKGRSLERRLAGIGAFGELAGKDRGLLLAWVLTVPVCILLGAGTFALGLYLTLHVFGLR